MADVVELRMKFECPHCKQSINGKADHLGKLVACPNCDMRFEASIQEETRPIDVRPHPALSQQKKRKISGLFVLFMFGALTFAVLVAIVFIKRDSPAVIEEARKNEIARAGISAEKLAKQVLLNHLKAPKTAEVESKVTTNDSGSIFVVKGKVTSENSFGANLTNDFLVSLGRDDTKSPLLAYVLQVGTNTYEFNGGAKSLLELKQRAKE